MNGEATAPTPIERYQPKKLQGVKLLRLPEGKVKQAILYPELDIRAKAVRYFAKSHSPDTSVMPLVIQAVEAFGREVAFHLIGSAREVAQTEETIGWIIDQLNQDQSDRYENYTYNLSLILLNADPILLLPRESDILEAQHFLPELHPAFCERLEMLSWGEETCWEKLDIFGDEAKAKDQINEVNLSYGKRIVEALARYGSSCEEKVESLLRQKIVDYSHHPMKWKEPLLVRLAGQAQLESLIPLILAKLEEDSGDVVNEACAEALSQIGTPAVLEAVSKDYPTAPRHFRIYASDPLESIRSDLAVEKCLQLLGQEKDRGIQIILASALLHQFATEGIAEARKLLIGQKLDFESRGLRSELVETCLLMDERFPEFDKWRSEIQAEREEHRKRVKELENDPIGLLKFAMEKLTGKTPELEPRPETQSSLTPVTKIEGKQKIGRNDPCPCGSGKKYKKCCLNKLGDDPLLN